MQAMKTSEKSWWFLFGVIFAPYVLLVVLLEGYWGMRLDLRLNLDLRLWIWVSWALSLAAGVVSVWRLPLHWFLRLDISVLYVLFVGYSLIMAADRFAASLS